MSSASVPPPRPAPFRMPDRLFAELATGGGSDEAVAFLVRGERARRLLLLRTLLDRLAALPTPLTPAAETWQTVKEAAERAPDAVDALLLAPATGGWLAHLLRRVHGTSGGPPLWAEAGHLTALAVAASLRAGTEADLRVVLSDGGLHLPGLGRAVLFREGAGPEGAGSAGEGLGVDGPAADEPAADGPEADGPAIHAPALARARTSAGILTLTGEDRHGRTHTLRCRPATAPIGARTPGDRDSPGWLPLRTLTHRSLSHGSLSIPLDDLDPYRDLDDPVPPARLEEAEAGAWQRMFEEAVGLVEGGGAGTRPGGPGAPGRLDPAWIRAVVPWGRTALTPPAPATVVVSASSGDTFGAMVIARPATALPLAEALVHEFQHSKLGALLHLFPLLDDDRAERFYAPWRGDPRHLTGLLHGAYAFTAVAGFWRDRTADPDHPDHPDDPEHADRAAYYFALRRLQSRLVVRTLLTSGRLTAAGHRLVSGLAATLDGWLREPVPPAALARARTAAALHRTEWRLRNALPGPPGTLRLRPDRRTWTDLRTHAFATAPTAPRTADGHLAAGDPATALRHYATDLDRDPADTRTLAGWIVARAALTPGPAARRLLARPELRQPQPQP
ncbi:HEXXH motif-containing putative peptide modification protein [Streptomyces sp. NPDC004610]|uniref:aKG-HExxH-type peptide beta-hydroxylase n=1 Tax=unclassified Streptomyces TaxID=2593676 RepID=UPI0033B581D1